MKPIDHGDTCFCSECRDAEGGDIPQSVSELVNAIKEKIKDLTYYVKENAEMLPNPEEDGKPVNTPSSRQGDKRTYLEPFHLSETPIEFDLKAVRFEPEARYGPRVVLKLERSGQTLYWGVHIKKNPNYKLLVNHYGRDETTWKGKISMSLKRDDFDNNLYPAASWPAEEKKGRK